MRAITRCWIMAKASKKQTNKQTNKKKKKTKKKYSFANKGKSHSRQWHSFSMKNVRFQCAKSLWNPIIGLFAYKYIIASFFFDTCIIKWDRFRRHFYHYWIVINDRNDQRLHKSNIVFYFFLQKCKSGMIQLSSMAILFLFKCKKSQKCNIQVDCFRLGGCLFNVCTLSLMSNLFR